MSLPNLAHQLVTASGHEPRALSMFCHGVFGMGTNLRTIAQKLVARSPAWGVVLVDLRGHGATPVLPPPHTLAEAARDVARLADTFALPVRAFVGHSFGGKVVLELLAQEPGRHDGAVIIDSLPGPGVPGPEVSDALRVLEALERVEQPIPSRESFRTYFENLGFGRPWIDWMAMNVRRSGEAFHLRLDLPAIRSMLTDYYRCDLWPALDDPLAARQLTLVIAGKSTIFGPTERARAGAAAVRNPSLEVALLPASGHWVHVDDPDGLVELLVRRLPEP